MKTFDYHQPDNLNEAIGLLKTEKNSMLYAGGTDAITLLKDEIITPQNLINIKRVKNLNYISYEPHKGLKIGALVRISELAENPLIKEKYKILNQAANLIASPQIRNIGTVGGNLCQRPRCHYFRGDFKCLRKRGDICYAVSGQNKLHCIAGGGPCYMVHPSDLSVALTALDANVTIADGNNLKTIPLKDFFVLPSQDVIHENILKPGEVITEISIPDQPADTSSGFLKFMERAVWDFSIVSVGAVIAKNGNKISKGKIVFGGIAPKPWEIENVDKKLEGITPDKNAIRELTNNLFFNAEPLEMNKYKITLAKNLTTQLLTELTM